jgi:hypothetical protein
MPEDERPPKTSLVFPILLISIGALFLARTFYPHIEWYHVLKTYGPLLLILVGIGKLWDYSRNRAQGGTSSGVALGSTLGVVAFIFVMLILIGHYQKVRQRDAANGEYGSDLPEHSSQVIETRDLDGAKVVSAELHMGGGELNVSGGSAHLLNANFHFDRKWDSPKVEYHVNGDRGVIEVNQDGATVNLGPTGNTWDLNFSNEVPMEMRVDMAAGQGNLRLRDMNLNYLEIHVGAGQLFVDLTGARKSDLNVQIAGGVGQVTVRLPKDVGVKAYAAGGIGTVQASGGLHKDGSEYTNDALGKSKQTIRLDVKGGIGEIELQQE